MEYSIMREINANEIQEVSGGGVGPLHYFAIVGAAEFMYEFFAGVDEGLGEG
ncbi:lactobin A/cerein 7B family class IIb bacteriocin [Pseudoalteromonas sp. SG43-3]|uniref:lactobin A/cerein 7B family class IIb bacteriocin n=1 Tax=Pseudoalteromonas sp. SG43-3 TaxID=2760970 RepID=UPI00160286BE|nr:lactobin A/cerein 7B family class IIb bacteriocin [Pseudoalteromonas sp. SG43-3]MBB1442880.1 lactobin A/cerein 7B family class IIb bacteriocin [Pseudoalteromonas sp. SG43-3]